MLLSKGGLVINVVLDPEDSVSKESFDRKLLNQHASVKVGRWVDFL